MNNRNTTTRYRVRIAALAAAALVAVFGGSAHAQLYWSGNGSTIGGSGTWDTTNQRWDDTVAGPFETVWDNTANASTQAVFQTTRGTVTVQAGGISVGTITPINATSANPWVFTGGNITLGSWIGPASGTNETHASFSNNIALPNATTFFYRGGASTLNISGQLSGAGGVTNDNGNTAHTLTLAGDNSGWSGGMTMPGMNYVLGHNNALGTGLVAVAAASPVISATTPLTAINTPFQHAATGGGTSVELIRLSGNHAMTFNGNLSWSSGANSGTTRGFNVTSSEVMTWNGVISQTSTSFVRNFRKSGSGTLVLGGANTYGLTTGTTTVAEGTLLVNNTTGSGTGLTAVVVDSAAVIGGNGSISGNLTLASGALFAFDTGSTLDLAGTLSLDSSFGVASLRNSTGGAINWSTIAQGTYPLMNTSFVFNDTNISNFGQANQATGLAGGKSAYFQQGSGPSSLQLVVVPEPAMLGLATLGAGLVGVAIWRRRRG